MIGSHGLFRAAGLVNSFGCSTTVAIGWFESEQEEFGLEKSRPGVGWGTSLARYSPSRGLLTFATWHYVYTYLGDFVLRSQARWDFNWTN
jgi:hypothetical protein